MIKLVGFNAASGQITSETTGQVIDWSNRILRCVTDEDLAEGDFGFAVFEQKLKKSEVCKSLGLNANASDYTVNETLCKFLNAQIEFTMGRVGKELKVNGFRIIK